MSFAGVTQLFAELRCVETVRENYAKKLSNYPVGLCAEAIFHRANPSHLSIMHGL
jgi:hypothetical protein